MREKEEVIMPQKTTVEFLLITDVEFIVRFLVS